MGRLDAIYRIASLAGMHHLARRRHARRLLIVCYHGLREDEDPARHWLLLPRSEFDAQIAYLAAHYECLPIDVALDRLWIGELRVPTACITFDDGYRNNVDIGLPVLRRHGAPATIYLATGLIGTGALLWTTALELAFRHSPRPHVDVGALGMGIVALADASARARAGKAVSEALKARPASERRALHAALLAQLDAADEDDRRPFALMDWAEARALADSGLVSLGGHTVHHEIVSRLDDAALSAEIAGSIDAVRREVPGAVTATFAYPNGGPGDFDARAEAVLARAGCTAALTTTEGLNGADTPRLRLRRLVVGAEITLENFVGRAAAFRELLAR